MRTKAFETVNWSYDPQSKIGTIELNRPESLNALSEQLKDDIVASFNEFETIDDQSDGVTVRCVIVEGAGDAFCAGADITEFDDTFSNPLELHEAWTICERYGAPVIAKIDGYCFGGGMELALACDFRIASDESEFGLPEIDLGLLPGGGGTQRLTQLVGPSRAKELTITGDVISSTQAANENIINAACRTSELDKQVQTLAEKIASKPPLAVRALKDVINYAQESGLREGRLYEHRTEMTLTETSDHQEGARAFFEDDYEPTFEGK